MGKKEAFTPFTKAVKQDAKLRLAVCGPGGSGKTFTLLKLATELGGKIAVVDTEHGSASKYTHTPQCAADCVDPSHFNFDVTEPATFDPKALMSFIGDAVKGGYSSLICDSLSHYWMGPNGELEMVDAAARANKGNSFAGWKTVTPVHNRLVDMMLSAPINILVSMRTKTEWVVEKDEKTGKSVPRKIGLAPIMRDGIEYEFDVCGDMDQDNNLTITKSRCSGLQGKSINQPGKEMADVLKAWLGTSGGAQTVNTSTVEGTNVAEPAPEVPGPLKLMVDGLARPGAKKEALGLLKQQLLDAIPGGGEAVYAEILKNHGLKPGSPSTIEQTTAALIEMYEKAEAARAVVADTQYHASDDDIPDIIGGKQAAFDTLSEPAEVSK